MVIGNNLNLVDELLLPQAREHHSGKQPLRELKPCRSPEVDSINVCRNSLSWHLDYKVVLERIEILLVSGTYTFGETLELWVLEQLINNFVLVKVKVEGSERACASYHA